MSRGYYLHNATAGYIGNSPLLWREGGSGYTQWIDEAEVFSEELADATIESCRGSHDLRKLDFDVVQKAAKRTVDIQDILT